MSNRTDGIIWEGSALDSPHTQADKAARVRRMFDAIAPTYELVNTLASAGRDAYWRREMVRLAKVGPDDVLLDIACGSGDVVRSFASPTDGGPRPARIIGLDFSLPMLQLAAGRPIAASAFTQADALSLPLADASVSITTCAFGIRNFQDLSTGLREMYRVLRPGGRAVILEFGVPSRPVFRHLYFFYATHVLPVVASLLSRDRTGAYRYLPSSVLSFCRRGEVVSSLKGAGFPEVTVHPLTWGVVAIYVAWKT